MHTEVAFHCCFSSPQELTFIHLPQNPSQDHQRGIDSAACHLHGHIMEVTRKRLEVLASEGTAHHMLQAMPLSHDHSLHVSLCCKERCDATQHALLQVSCTLLGQTAEHIFLDPGADIVRAS